MSVDSRESEIFTEVYTWVDDFEFSKPKKNISRDFSDGVFIAEIV